jgi:RNA polymerase sigma factor (sigma-70 family)
VRCGELLRRAADGDQLAWNELVERHARLVWAACRSYRLSPEDTADVAQVTWLRLVEHLHRIEDGNRVSAWLLTTAKREAYRVCMRQGRVRPVQYEDVDLPDPSPGPYDQTERSERQRAVQAALGRLPKRDQLMLRVMSQDKPPSYAELASTLQIPIGSIGPRRMRALARLRQELEAADSPELWLSAV